MQIENASPSSFDELLEECLFSSELTKNLLSQVQEMVSEDFIFDARSNSARFNS
jgi:hypothetical protein